MWRAAGVAFLPYVAMLVGLPFMNSSADIIGIPRLGAWILLWVVVTPAFLLLAQQLLPESEREDDES